MIEIGVIGTTSSKKITRIANAVIFYADLLMPKDVVEELNIDVILSPDCKEVGFVYPADEEEFPRFFEIVLKANHSESLYMTIAHEMVHLKQYAMGDVPNCFHAGTPDPTVKFWRKQVWSPTLGEDPYFDSPWEIEAFGREVGLYHRYKTRNRKQIP